ncbi:hypothetical protein BGZ82_007199 [Podila clonocystis]|nr:hypothetical protein BGZ82_007199 [Podila clonocystis]
MMSMIRNTIAKAAAPARRSISNSTKTNAALSMHTGVESTAVASTSGSSSAAKVAKVVVYTSAVVAGAAYFVKDEVVYWTPNVRK